MTAFVFFYENWNFLIDCTFCFAAKKKFIFLKFQVTPMDTKQTDQLISEQDKLLLWLCALDNIEKWTPEQVEKLFPCDKPNDAKFYNGKSHMAHKWSKMPRKCAMAWLQHCDPVNQRASLAGTTRNLDFRRQYDFTLMLAFLGLPEAAPDLTSLKEQRDSDPNFQKTTATRFLCSMPKEQLFALFSWFEKSYKEAL